MKGGIGTAMLDLSNGVRVAALMAVNSLGNIVDPETGRQVAGVRTADGSAIVDARDLLRNVDTTRCQDWREHNDRGRGHERPSQ